VGIIINLRIKYEKSGVKLIRKRYLAIQGKRQKAKGKRKRQKAKGKRKRQKAKGKRKTKDTMLM